MITSKSLGRVIILCMILTGVGQVIFTLTERDDVMLLTFPGFSWLFLVVSLWMLNIPGTAHFIVVVLYFFFFLTSS